MKRYQEARAEAEMPPMMCEVFVSWSLLSWLQWSGRAAYQLMGVPFDVFGCGMGQAETGEVDCREGIGPGLGHYFRKL